ncbi:thioredoxin family protein [Cohnella caldifontis]|uniref:thioredoxin family protein n=1 Tax=Cohnella caldifontis TaxID=3027471 RepID=UPI0023EC3A6A|nr:thioredoxin family protein [Cohnella sp. YIM B05605]
MKETLNLKHKLGQGITPGAFMEGMETRVMVNSKIPNTRELFHAKYEKFGWANKEDEFFFLTYKLRVNLQCLILCTDWCPDVMWNVPVLFRVMETAGIPTEVLPMESHLETMDLFLTDGGRAQPIAVFLNPNGDVLGRWGARPAYIQTVMDRFKAQYPDRQHPDYQQEINRVYGEIGDLYHDGDKYRDVMIQELKTLFETFA